MLVSDDPFSLPKLGRWWPASSNGSLFRRNDSLSRGQLIGSLCAGPGSPTPREQAGADGSVRKLRI